MSRASIMLLTFDEQAGMAYLYLKPGSRRAIVSTHNTSFGEAGAIFHAFVDCDQDGRSVGVEFPAETRAQALARAVEVEGNVA